MDGRKNCWRFDGRIPSLYKCQTKRSAASGCYQSTSIHPTTYPSLATIISQFVHSFIDSPLKSFMSQFVQVPNKAFSYVGIQPVKVHSSLNIFIPYYIHLLIYSLLYWLTPYFIHFQVWTSVQLRRIASSQSPFILLVWSLWSLFLSLTLFISHYIHAIYNSFPTSFISYSFGHLLHPYLIHPFLHNSAISRCNHYSPLIPHCIHPFLYLSLSLLSSYSSIQTWIHFSLHSFLSSFIPHFTHPSVHSSLHSLIG